ncbi:hypothetical protein ABFT23_21760 [Nocardioides sp. C4-1]|uniref:hypothetical protein n=1 Tax=Nocardioides sp. C4-1 TaxID=3151851 RepID=UPI0032671DC0
MPVLAPDPVATTTASPPPVGAARRPWPADWPLLVLLLGYPVWWLLGVDSLLPLALAVPMVVQLRRQHRLGRLHLPAGTTWWLLFLVWVAIGATMLWVDAPDAVPGGGPSRLLVFGFRWCWYAASGVVLLWVANLPQAISDRRVRALLGSLFVVCVAGGYLGLFAPAFELRSATELLLPRSIRANEFVLSLVHPQAADVQTLLGRPETRPKAPFPFTNTWGSCLSITLVFFVAALRESRPRVRAAGLVVLVLAAVPVVYSLNRGLWASVALGVVGLVVLALRRGSRATFAAVVVSVVLAVLLLLASPLGALYQDRLDHQHSNDRRGQLLEATVDSVTHGSPVLGFGTTRDVQGSFASITGAATPQCPACGVPPLGTQGQLWLVVFSQGWVGLALFLGFLARALARSWRCRTPGEAVATAVLAFFVLQLPIYDTLGMPLYLVMIAVGLVARQQRPAHEPARRPARRRATVALALLLPAAVGVGGGLVVARAERTTDFASRVSVLITPAPVYLDTGTTADGRRLDGAAPPREITVDTEAALLTSQAALTRASRASGSTTEQLRAGVTVTAPPSSQVLDVTVRSATSSSSQRAATAVADAYLDVRREYLENRRDETLRGLREQLRSIAPEAGNDDLERDLTTAIAHLRVGRPTIGRVIRQEPAVAVGSQPVVPIASGAALGLLAGVLWLRRRPTDPDLRRPTIPRSRP